VQEAGSALPVPDPASDASLRRALDSTATAVSDCVRAIAAGDARLLEKSIAELREARAGLDEADRALAAWR
jgi:hypothetical protein